MNGTIRFQLPAIVILFVSQAGAWAQNIDIGEMEYLSSCAPCHGRDASGKGPLSNQLKVVPTDLTRLAKKNGGVFPTSAVYEKIDGRQEVKSHGTREMPIWGYRYQPLPIGADETTNRNLLDPEPIIRARILALVDYLNRVQKK